MLLLALGLIGWAWVSFFTTDNEDSTFPLIAATIALIAIVYGAHQALHVQTIRYTLDSLSQRFANQSYVANIQLVSEAKRTSLLTSTSTKSALVVSYDGRKLVEALGHLLNYWEFLCTAYCRMHLDRRVFEETVSDLVIELVALTASYIAEERSQGPDGYEYLVTLFYCFATPDQRKAYVPLLGPAPFPLSHWDRAEWATRYGGQPFDR